VSRIEPQKRHWSRRFALQALYQWQLTGHSIDELIAQYTTDEKWENIDKDYFVELLRESICNADELTAEFAKHIDLSSKHIDPIEKAILLFSTYELLNKNETPAKVIISEAIILCKKFGSIEGYKFINGVLDKVAETRS